MNDHSLPPIGAFYLETWLRNPERMCFASARYKWIMRHLTGLDVAEIGAADGTLSRIVGERIDLTLFDIQPRAANVHRLNIVHEPLPRRFDAIYMVDVLEHIEPVDEPAAMRNIRRSLNPHGIFIAGVPSLESQVYANEWSKVGHVNCRSGNDLREAMREHFHNVFLYTMNDEMIGTGFAPMAHYLFVLCCGPKWV